MDERGKEAIKEAKELCAIVERAIARIQELGFDPLSSIPSFSQHNEENSNRRRKRPKEKSTIETTNRYAALEEEEHLDTEMQETATSSGKSTNNKERQAAIRALEEEAKKIRNEESQRTTQKDTKPRNSKPPPIITETDEHFNKIKKIANGRGINFRAKMTPVGQKFFTENIEDFRILNAALEVEKVPFHSFPLKEDKPLRAVVRGVPTTMTTDDMVAELKTKGFPIINAKRMGKKEQPFPMMIVTLPKNEEGKKIFDLKEVGNCIVRTEPKKKNHKTIQCFRCQRLSVRRTR